MTDSQTQPRTARGKKQSQTDAPAEQRGTRRSGGRPMVDADEKKSVVLASRYTVAEYEEIVAKAARAGVRPSSFQSAATNDKRLTSGGKHSDPEERAALVALERQLHAIGINLNQLMPLAHTTRQRPSQLPDTLKAVNEAALLIIEHMSRKKPGS